MSNHSTPTTPTTQTIPEAKDSSQLIEDLKHPLRLRIVGLLAGAPAGRTQSEIGKALSLSNAAVHYHIKVLEALDVIHLLTTRPGPNGIVEKLYGVDPRTLDLTGDVRTAFYLEFTLAHMGEMQREGKTLLEADAARSTAGCAVGCYETYADPIELVRLKDDLMGVLDAFHQRNRAPREGARPVAITLGLLPSNGAGWSGIASVLDFGPGRTGGAAD